MKKILLAALIAASSAAHADSAACRNAAEVVQLMADRRDEGMTKMQAIDRIANYPPQEQAAAMVVIDMVWSYPRVPGAKMSRDFLNSCLYYSAPKGAM